MRDHTRDPVIMDAALDLLAEMGYEGMTINLVAARAKAGKATLYRRWSSKSELLLDAIACMKPTAPDALPDTGTLREDLLGMIKTTNIRDGQRKIKILSGIASMANHEPKMAEAARRLVEDRGSPVLLLLERAIVRGEIPGGLDVENISLAIASMVSYRVLMLNRPADSEFLVAVVDKIVMPAVAPPT